MKKVLMLLFAAIILVACNNDKPEETTTEEPEETIEESYEEEVEDDYEEIEELTEREIMISNIVNLIDEGYAFDTGSYIKGDIPKGEYAFITFNGESEYYVEKDNSGNIIDNENFDSFGYVQVHEAGNIEIGGFLINDKGLKELELSGAKELYEIINEKEDYVDAGYYKVGVDIDPGEYVIESYGEGYVAVMSGPVGNSSIVDNNNFNGKYSVNLQEGQYLNVSKSTITK